MEARCAAHPERPAAGTCQRCGVFACEEDLAAVAIQALCTACAARPDATYLEAFRLKYWGKRDGFAWLWGALVPVMLAGAVAAYVADLPLAPWVTLALAAGGALYFLGRRWARPLIFLLPAVTAAWAALAPSVHKVPQTAWRSFTLVGLVLALLPAMLSLAVYLDGRNQLFFQVALPPEKLRKVWDAHANNRAARNGFLLSLTGLIVPGLSLFGMGFSIYGLTRVDPTARPPIGRRSQAVGGIVLGGLGVIEWVAYLTMMRVRSRL